MAIQKINLGTEPLGEGGDTYRSANTKINENFSNTSHAASRLVGKEKGNLIQVGFNGVGDSWDRRGTSTAVNGNPEALQNTGLSLSVEKDSSSPYGTQLTYIALNLVPLTLGSSSEVLNARIIFRGTEAYIQSPNGTEWGPAGKIYHSGSTKKDSNTNLLLDPKDSIPSNSAASKLVGKVGGRVPLVEDVLYANLRTTTSNKSNATAMDYNELEAGTKYFVSSSSDNGPDTGTTGLDNRHTVTTGCTIMTDRREQWSTPYVRGSTRLFYRNETNDGFNPWVEFYTTGNTTIGTNKEIVTSSPVVRVFRDKIEAIHEAKDLPLEFVRNSEGVYTLKGTTGLRNGQNDWQIIIPKDNHDNQLIAFTLDEDADGTIHLKTYKRTFSMETFTFGPDLNTPLDIPEGRWVDLHFNDIPQEELDEPEPDEDSTVDVEEEPEVEEEPTEEPSEESK